MTLTIDFPQEVDAWLEEEASRRGQAPAEFVRAAITQMRPGTSALMSNDALTDWDSSPTDWDALDRIIDANQIETGIPDLAHQHDHYIHGKPKRD